MASAVTRVCSAAWQGYKRSAKSHPNVTQAMTGASVWAIGNMLTQRERHKAGKHPKFDVREMAAFSSYGVVLAPVGHKWYMVLESVLARRMAMGFWTMIGAKLAADTFLFGPVHIACMLTWTTLAQGRSLEDVKDTFKKNYIHCFEAEAALWLPAQLLNFTRVPPHHQQLYVNVVTVIEAVLMSWICAQQEDDAPVEMAALDTQLPLA